MIWELFWRFVVVSLLAFGGGQAALPLIERLAVHETGWVSAEDFSSAVAFGYVTPGPVLITAAFIGYRAAELPGALAATLGVFLMPWLLAAAAARQIQRFMRHPWLRGFGRGASPAVVGLLGVTALTIGQHTLVNWVYTVIAGVALVLALRTQIHPIVIVTGGALLGALSALWMR